MSWLLSAIIVLMKYMHYYCFLLSVWYLSSLCCVVHTNLCILLVLLLTLFIAVEELSQSAACPRIVATSILEQKEEMCIHWT